MHIETFLHNCSERVEANVKWYCREKGYGFLVDQAGGPSDIFIHFSILDQVGCRGIKKGDHMMCDVLEGERGRQVSQVLSLRPSSHLP